jgi:hypothetical protein
MQKEITEALGLRQYEPELPNRLPVLDRRWLHG